MTGDEWKRKQAGINVLIDEYERDVQAALNWYFEWKKRNSGFRCTRRANDGKEIES